MKKPDYLDTSAVISPCEQYRYVLRRRWAEGGRTLLWCLINPSTADAARDDHTVRKGVGFSQRWGFNAMVFANLFAYRATDADKLLTPKLDIIGPDNDHWLDLLIGQHEHVILAWGAHHPHLVETRMPALTALLEKHHRSVWCLGTNNGGSPKHPLKLGYDTPRERIAWEATS